jgi:hypothetical protein
MIVLLGVAVIWAGALVLAMVFVRGATRQSTPHHHHDGSCSVVATVADRRYVARHRAA